MKYTDTDKIEILRGTLEAIRPDTVASLEWAKTISYPNELESYYKGRLQVIDMVLKVITGEGLIND